MNIPILFENDDLLIVNKPSGLVVHSDGKTKEATLVDWILECYPELQGVGENMYLRDQEIEIERPGIVHRIDRDTSGCLVIAKTPSSFEYLKSLFQERKIQKTYTALVYGWVKEDTGSIDQAIGRSQKDFRMKQAGKGARGELREALTEYAVEARLFDPKHMDNQGQNERYTLVSCFPKTGRTHQIRVHMKWLNHPIVADPLYSGKRRSPLPLSRTALHAASLAFDDMTGKHIEVSAPLPLDMKDALARLDNIS